MSTNNLLECPDCGFRITAEQKRTASTDYACERCGRMRWSSFQPVRRFPIHSEDRRLVGDCPASVPFEVVKRHEAQAQRNHSQTVERLAQRGGLDLRELYAVVHEREFYSLFYRGHADEPTLAQCLRFAQALAYSDLDCLDCVYAGGARRGGDVKEKLCPACEQLVVKGILDARQAKAAQA